MGYLMCEDGFEADYKKAGYFFKDTTSPSWL